MSDGGGSPACAAGFMRNCICAIAWNIEEKSVGAAGGCWVAAVEVGICAAAAKVAAANRGFLPMSCAPSAWSWRLSCCCCPVTA